MLSIYGLVLFIVWLMHRRKHHENAIITDVNQI